MVGKDEALCYENATGGYAQSGILLVRVQNAKNGTNGGASPVKVSKLAQNNSPGGLQAPLSSWYSTSGTLQYPPNPTNNTFVKYVPSTYANPITQEMGCYALDNTALCLVIWSADKNSGYNSATYQMSVYRWTPNASDSTFLNTDLALLDAAHLPIIWPSEVVSNFNSLGLASPIPVGHPQCFRSQQLGQTNTFTCLFRFTNDKVFYRFNLQDCGNMPGGSYITPTDTNGPGGPGGATPPPPTYFGNTSTSPASTTNWQAAYASSMPSAARIVPTANSATIYSYTTAGYGNYLKCTGASTGAFDHYCIASYIAHAANSPFHLWRWAEDSGTMAETSASPVAGSTLNCPTTGTNACDISLNSPYYNWNSTSVSGNGSPDDLEDPYYMSIGIDQ